MSDVGLTTDHDLNVIDNDLVVLTGLDAKVQKLKQEYKMFLGEWFLNTSKGVPYIQKIFTKQVNVSEVDAILKNVILDSEDVIELISFDLQLNSDRRLLLDFSVRFEEGVATINEVI